MCIDYWDCVINSNSNHGFDIIISAKVPFLFKNSFSNLNLSTSIFLFKA